LLPENLLNINDLPVQYIAYQKNFYRLIKNRPGMLIQLGTKKIDFGQKSPDCIKKSQNHSFGQNN
jgi:hypothetical protein